MTREEAKAKQDEIEASGFNLGYWYGTGCKKCCGVYPKFKTGTYRTMSAGMSARSAGRGRKQ